MQGKGDGKRWSQETAGQREARDQRLQGQRELVARRHRKRGARDQR